MNFFYRIQQLQKILSRYNCDSLFIEDPTNLYYLTGIPLSTGVLIVSTNDAWLLVDGRYIESAKKKSPVPVHLTDHSQESLESFFEKECPFLCTLGFISDKLTYKKYLGLEKISQKFSQKVSSKLKLVPLENPINHLRAIKDVQEIVLLKDAAKLAYAGFEYISSLLKEGVTEEEIAAALEIFWKKKGSKCVAFEPIIAFGKNSSMPHYRAGKTALKKGDTVLFDIGVNIDFYHSDMTRVLFFGEPDPEMRKIFEIVKQAQQKAFDICRPGTKIGELDVAARDYITSQGYGDKFSHGLGHGIGLEIHEWPLIKNTAAYKDIVLEPGMVFTIEPGVYVPDLGGVRIEDTVLVTENGYESLTKP